MPSSFSFLLLYHIFNFPIAQLRTLFSASFLLEANGIGTSGIVKSKDRITTVKTRVIAQNHQMLRIDSEITHNLNQVDSFKLVEISSRHS